jgi:hypothetical protein
MSETGEVTRVPCPFCAEAILPTATVCRYSTDGTAGHRERLWLSPACIGTEQEVLFT